MKIIELQELKQIQMDVLDAIDEYCKENGIRYSIACGTLLGAARHKGYIPWDDDIDIYVPREDYKRLIHSFPDNYKDRYKIVCLERDRKWERSYAKAYDVRTEFCESGSSDSLGVNIDIFPIDDVPDDDKVWSKYNRKRLMLIYLSQLRFVRLSRNRSIFKNLIIILIRLFSCFISRRRIAEIIDQYAQKYNGLGYARCYESCAGMFQLNPFNKDYFNHLIKLPFENRKYYAFEDFDICLTAGFGNWRQLPPEEKRVSHHLFKAYWK